MSHTIGIDVGGTFTDFVLTEAGGGELRATSRPSTPSDPSDGVVTGLRELAALQGQDLAGFLASTSTDRARHHGDDERGAHRARRADGAAHDGGLPRRPRDAPRRAQPDAPLRQQVRRAAAARAALPAARRCASASTSTARSLTPLDERRRSRAALDAARAHGVEAIAVCFMHAYANAAHERAGRRAWSRELAPERLPLASRREVLPAGAALRARVDDGDERLRRPGAAAATSSASSERLAERGFGGAAAGHAVQRRRRDRREIVAAQPGDDGALRPGRRAGRGRSPTRARGRAERLHHRRHGRHELRRLARSRTARPQVTRDGEVNRHPMSLPMIDVHTIGAGGGCIGWLDDGRPPARRARRARAPTRAPPATAAAAQSRPCTDADLVLGYLDPGLLPRRPDAAATSSSRSGRSRSGSRRRSGLDVVEAAAGDRTRSSTSTMAARHEGRVRSQRGYDPRDFPLVVAGGAGAVHAGAIAARARASRTVIVPATLVGALRARHAARRPAPRLRPQLLTARCGARSMPTAARALLDGMRRAGRRRARPRGRRRRERRTVVVAADMRYVGQHHEVGVELPARRLSDGADGPRRIERAFQAATKSSTGSASRARRSRSSACTRWCSAGEAPDLRRSRRRWPASALKGHRAAWLPTRAQARGGRGPRRRPPGPGPGDPRAGDRGRGDDDGPRARGLRLRARRARQPRPPQRLRHRKPAR